MTIGEVIIGIVSGEGEELFLKVRKDVGFPNITIKGSDYKFIRF